MDRPPVLASISGVGGGGGNGSCPVVLARKAALASIFGGAVGGCFCSGEGCLSCDGAAFAGGGVGGVLVSGTNGHVVGGGGPGGPGKTVSTVPSGNGGGGGGAFLCTGGAGGGGIRAESSWRMVGVQVATAFGVAVTAV